MNALDQYIENIDELARKLSPSERKHLLQKIGRQIRQNNKKRIQSNVLPTGSPMLPRAGGKKDYLNGWRKLGSNEDLSIGQPFYYEGLEMRKHNRGVLRQMLSIKRPEHDRKYGFPYRTYKGGGYYQRSPYDLDYVQGYATGGKWEGGVSKFSRKHIYVKGKGGVRSRLMFRKIHQYKYLKLKATSHEAAIGFLGGLVGYIANAHQHGEDNRPERQLVGFSNEDLALIEQMLYAHFSA